MTEIWKQIKEHPKYSVSNFGRVRNDERGIILKPFKIGTKGKGNQYFAVDLYPSRSVRVHRLVAMAFIPNTDNKPEVNHKDGDHFNNQVSNLEWVTGSENCYHAYNTLNRKRLFGADNPYSRRVVRIEDGKVFGSLIEAARECGIGRSSISKCVLGQREKAGGFHWKYD